MESREYTCEKATGMRLDSGIAFLTGDISRSQAQRLIESGAVLVCGKEKKTGYKLAADDIITIDMPDPVSYDAVPQDIPIDIVYQDRDIAVINKKRGMVVHPAPGHYDGTLVNAVMYHIKDLSGIGGVERPGIVHRIDKDTSGLIVIAKNDNAHEALCKQLEDKTMNRRYLAVCKGNFRESRFIVEKHIDRSKKDRKKMAVCDDGYGRYAKTEFTVIAEANDYTLLECKLFTGRTHQIRVHLSYVNHPIVGDEVYGKKGKVGFNGQALHAYKLEFKHPKTGEVMVFTAPLPVDFKELLKKTGINADLDMIYS